MRGQWQFTYTQAIPVFRVFIAPSSYTPYSVRAMWVNEEVDVLARHVVGIDHPLVKAIRWHERRIDMQGAGQVERKTIGLEYVCESAGDRYFLQFTPRRGRWVLLRIDDSGLHDPDDLPPSRAFPPPNWSGWTPSRSRYCRIASTTR